MHFLVLAWDAPGPDGASRRDAVRPAHAASIRELWEQGRVVLGAGILDEAGGVRGSVVIVDYPGREDVERYLASEPFATEGVWDRVEVHPLRVPDFYLQR
ncbi:MAG TPA: YciI family protein [Acidimicrobiales bacterium]|nr:YciI family protein [Acidimicrobiales bacterium]